MMNLWKLAHYALAGWVPGGHRLCVMCDHRVWRYMPYRKGSRDVPPLMRALDTIGSDPDYFECPRCGSHDRERHLFLYMQRTGLLDRISGRRVLHFAPEKRLSLLLKTRVPSVYMPADLFPSKPGILRADMLSMPFAACAFDFLIANHVLEHVPDAAKALAECFRVLKPGGEAILQTPYSRKLNDTWEDPGIDSAAARLQAHGQEDHVRLFGRDIFDQIVAAGFLSNVQKHNELLEDVDPVRYGVNPMEPFFRFRKPR